MKEISPQLHFLKFNSLFLVPACSTSHCTDYMMKVSQILFQSVHCIAGYVKTREAIAAEHSYPLSPLTYKVILTLTAAVEI